MTPTQSLRHALKRLLIAVIACVRKLARGLADLLPERASEPPVRTKQDVRVASPRKLFRALHDFLEDREYDHEYEPLKAERDAIGDIAIFQSELVGKREFPGRDVLGLFLGLLLIFTILLIPLAPRLLRRSLYTLTTVVKIGVEGEAYRCKFGTTGITTSEVLDVVSDARVTLHLQTGVMGEDSEISRPSRVRGEHRKISRVHQDLRDAFDRQLKSLALPRSDAPTI